MGFAYHLVLRLRHPDMKKVKREADMKMSELEAEREADAFTSDVGSSLDDTEDSSHDSDYEYGCDDIIAQRTHEEKDQDVVQYLVKFTDYPLHRQVI